MKREISQRWVLSFADLTLVLLAFFVLMQAQASDRMKMAAGLRDAFGGKGGGSGTAADSGIDGFVAGEIFEPGEAILKPGKADRLRAIGAAAARDKKRVIVASQGRDGENARLDAWELSAARTTAVARAIRVGGLSDSMIEIAIPPMRPGDPAHGQRLSVQQIAGH